MPVSKVKVDDSGIPTWKTASLAYTRVANTWRPCKQVWTKVGDTWKIVYDLTIQDEFNGSAGLLTNTPGNVPWQMIKGTFNLSGSGSATATTNSAVAAVETGLKSEISVEIDNDSSTNLSGMGTAFWIQDQNNWWGAQIYYEFYSTPSTYQASNNFYCTYTPYTGYYAPAYSVYANYWHQRRYDINVYSTGQTRYTGTRPCNPGGKYAYYVNNDPASYVCLTGCTYNPAGSGGNPCTSPNRWYSCGAYGTCNNCGTGSPYSSDYNTPGNNSCPSGYAWSSTYVGYTCNIVYGYYDYGYCVTNYSPVAAACYNNAGTQYYQYQNTDDSYGITAYCSPGSAKSCTSAVTYYYVPYTAYATIRKTRLLRSNAGTVSEISSTPNNGSAKTIGHVKATMSYANPTQAKVDVISYAGAGGTGEQYATISHTLPAADSAAALGTKHGIFVSSVPTTNTSIPAGLPLFGQPASNTTQGYSITRFKVNIP